jgi:hypothetical protein
MADSVDAVLASSSLTHPRPRFAIGGGLIVGMRDLLYAIMVYSPRHAILIPQRTASGVLGPKSYRDGTATCWAWCCISWSRWALPLSTISPTAS